MKLRHFQHFCFRKVRRTILCIPRFTSDMMSVK